MQKKQRYSRNEQEDAQLNAFVEEIAPREPILKVYRLEQNGRQTFLYATELDSFSLEDLRDHFGAGSFLLRTVRSNGTYGPSRVVHIGSIHGGY